MGKPECLCDPLKSCQLGLVSMRVIIFKELRRLLLAGQLLRFIADNALRPHDKVGSSPMWGKFLWTVATDLYHTGKALIISC